MDAESSTKFIGSLTKFLQSLCNGYVEFDDGVELIGHIYLSVDAGKTGKTLNYFLNEKVCKNDNSVTFISNSFHAQPDPKSKGKEGESRKEDGEVSDSGDNIPRSSNAGTASFRPQGSRSGASPNQIRTGMPAGSKRPGSPLKGPPSQRRAPTPPSQRRFLSSGPRGTVGSPVSKTVPSSPSSSSQDNTLSPSPARKSRSELSQPASNQSDNAGADNENDIPSNVLSINPTPEFASFLGSLTSDNQTSQDQHSPPDTKPDTDVTFIKEEFVSEPSSCAQAGSSGQQLGRSGEDSSGLYPVMLHQNTSVFPGTSFSGYQGGASSTATSQQPAFPGSSQSDSFNPVPGTSQDGADPSGDDELEDTFMVSSGYPQVQYYISEASSQKQCLTQDTMYDVTADHQDSDNSSSSATIAVSCDTPMVFSTDDHPTDSTADQTEAKYASSSFSFSEATTSFAGPHTLFSDPPQQVEDIKYDVSQYLIWSQHQETFSAEPEKRGRGRPRKSASRVRPYDGRKKAHKPLMDQKLTVLLPLRRGSGKARGSGGRGRSRGRRGLSSGAHSPSQPSVPFNGGISAVLLGGAIRTRDSSGRRGGRRKVTTPLHRGRGFHNIKNMVNRKYSYKLPQDQGVRGRGGGKSWGRARRGEGRSRASGRRGSRASTTAKIRRHKAGSEVKVNKDEISLQPALEESFPEGKDESDTHFHFPMTEALTVARKGELWGHAPEQGRVRRRPGRPRKHPGPSGGITPTHTDQKKKGASQSAEVKEEPADEKVIQALVEHIRRESALLSRRPHRRRGSLRRGAGRQRRSSAPSEHVSPQAIFMPVDDTTEGSEDKLVVSGSLSSLEDITSTSHPGPSSAEASDGARQRGKVTGRRRFRGRIRTLAGRGRGRLGLSTSRGTALARSILKMARGGHGKRIAGSMTPGRLGGLETRKDEDEEGLMSTPGPVRGSGMRSLRAVGRRGGYTAVRSRGLRKTGLKRLMPTLDKEDLPGRGRYKAVRSRGLRGRGIHKLMPTLNKEEDKSDHVADEAKPLECSRCGKRYDYKACFIRHMQTCESSSCYQCILCDQTFFDLGHFKHHGQNEHGIEEDDVMMLEKKQ